MSESHDAVYHILASELSKMLGALKADTPKNFRRKSNNFLLSRFDPEVIFYTVFTSSFESKSGNALENCAKSIARLRYGEQSVPNVVYGIGATQEDLSLVQATAPHKQIILTRKRISEVERHARSVLSQHRMTGRGRARDSALGVTQNILQSAVVGNEYPDGEFLEQKPVDLLILTPDDMCFCFEIKLGGDLDSSNAPAQITKFLTICALAGQQNLHGYFATIYNKDGEGNRFTGTVRSYLADDMILAGSAFWQLLLPPSVSFDDFVRLYQQVLDDLGINNAIREMAQNTALSKSDQQSVVRELTD